MKLTPEQLEAELLQLPPSVRARLADALFESLELLGKDYRAEDQLALDRPRGGHFVIFPERKRSAATRNCGLGP